MTPPIHRVYSYWIDHPHEYVLSPSTGCGECGYGIGAAFHNPSEIKRFQAQQAVTGLKIEIHGIFSRFVHRFVQSVDWSQRAPRFYGRAWSQWDKDRRICMPIPFNYIAGIARAPKPVPVVTESATYEPNEVALHAAVFPEETGHA